MVALLTSLKMTKAWPLIFRLRDTRISRIWPNWEKMAYRDFLSSAFREDKTHCDKRPGHCALTLALSLEDGPLIPALGRQVQADL